MLPSDKKPNERPTRKPFVPKPVTKSWLQNATRYYLERYSSSSENLRRVLLRKAKKRIGPGAELSPEAMTLIEEAVATSVSIGLIDDTRYAEARVNSLLRKGTSRSATRNKLLAKGVSASEIASALATAAPDDAALAQRYAQRKRLGPWRPQRGEDGPDPARVQKDLAAMMRAGFSYGVAKAALASDTGEDNHSV